MPIPDTSVPNGARAPRHDVPSSGGRAARASLSATRRPRRAAALASALGALAGTALYLPHLATGFASEDFLVLGRLAGRPLARTLIEELAGPWLGLEAVAFWRPVSTFLLALETRILGLDATRLHAAHLVIHALASWCVGWIGALALGAGGTGAASPDRAPEPRPHRDSATGGGAAPSWLAGAIAALWAVHPFHPAAVLFIGAFATLHGGLFALASVALFLLPSRRGVGSGRSLAAPGSVVAFALALGSYEGAAALPAVLLAIALLRHRGAAGARARLSGALRSVAPHLLVLLAYLAVRTAVLGAPVGGYGAFRARFLVDPGRLLGDLGRELAVLVAPPRYGTEPGTGWIALIAIALLALGATGLVARGSGRLGGAAGTPGHRLQLAVAAAAASSLPLLLAPYSFVGLVPANGRYGYLAIAALALLAGAGAAAAIAWRTPAETAAAALGLAALAIAWLLPLRAVLAAYDGSSIEVAAARAETVRVARSLPVDALLLIEDPPDFVKAPDGSPLAKTLQYGLAASLRPPFGELDATILGLPAIVAPEARATLGALPGARRFRWDPERARLVPAGPGFPKEATRAPPALLTLDRYDPERGELEASCRDCERTRLFLLTATLPTVLEPSATGDGVARFTVSARLLRGLAAHGRGPAVLWVEERHDRVATALSAPLRLELEPGREPAPLLAEAVVKMRPHAPSPEPSDVTGDDR